MALGNSASGKPTDEIHADRHTPGPWQIGYSDGSGNGPDGFCIVAANEQAVVYSGDSFGMTYGVRTEANARLIAAAPDLLAAARLALHEMCNTVAPRNSFTDAVDALDAAITKATSQERL